jgi:glycosyltransferase involved in cell wall biosynthesis
VKLPSRILVAAHISRIYGPVQALTGWLQRQKAAFGFVALPFGYSGIPSASFQRFRAGRLFAESAGHAAQGWDPWLWTKDFLYVLRCGWGAGGGLFIGVDALNALAGLVLRALGRVDAVAFYVIDYTPQRFSNPLLNAIYQLVDRIAATRSDVVWNLSERMREVRRSQGVPEGRNQLLPVGVELEAVKLPKAAPRKRSLLYMGALHDNKGLQLIVQAFPRVLAKVPAAELHIVGFGPFEAELKRLVAASPARKRIHLPGGLGHDELFEKVPRFRVALAPYLDAPGSYTWWCDPTKPKEYLACGLPIILTKVPWIWELIADARKPMGIAIDYNEEDLVQAMVRLLKDDAFYLRCRRNALAYARGLSWDGQFKAAFGRLKGV